MPLPLFLGLLAVVILAAGLTVALAVGVDLPLGALGIGALVAAGALRFLGRKR